MYATYCSLGHNCFMHQTTAGINTNVFQERKATDLAEMKIKGIPRSFNLTIILPKRALKEIEISQESHNERSKGKLVSWKEIPHSCKYLLDYRMRLKSRQGQVTHDGSGHIFWPELFRWTNPRSSILTLISLQDREDGWREGVTTSLSSQCSHTEEDFSFYF